MEVEQIMEEDQSLPLTEENIEKVLDEIRPYLVGEPSECSIIDQAALRDSS